MNPMPPPGPPHQPYQPYPYPYPPPVYVPPPADPLDFAEEPEPPPRRRRREEARSGSRGLVIALVVMAAVGLGWFGFVSVRGEWDAARLPEIRSEIIATWDRMERVAGPVLSRPNWSDTPGIQADYRRVKALYAEYRKIQQRHPDWRVPDPYEPW
jgi:hypothetical protein